jgi:hypothetical protein
MTLPASGAISMSQVNTELGLSSTAAISLDQAAVRSLFGIASGAISMSNGYGKSSLAIQYRGAASVTTVGGETVIVFNSTAGGSINVIGAGNIRVLAVGGGGAGGTTGNDRSGGGGGGGVIDTVVAVSAGVKNIAIGLGSKIIGTDYYGNPVWQAASASSVGGTIVVASQGQNSLSGKGNYGNGSTAGSSGTGSVNGTVVNTAFSGGLNGGGGGGAGAAAINASTSTASPGGIGRTSDITGTSTYYGGGGGGGSICGVVAGGTGGGGASAGYRGTATSGTNGLGGGGGGACAGTPGGGGTGLIIIRGAFTASAY